MVDGAAGFLELGVHKPSEEADDVVQLDRQYDVTTVQLFNVVASELPDVAIVALLGAGHDTSADKCGGRCGGGSRGPSPASRSRGASKQQAADKVSGLSRSLGHSRWLDRLVWYSCMVWRERCGEGLGLLSAPSETWSCSEPC